MSAKNFHFIQFCHWSKATKIKQRKNLWDENLSRRKFPFETISHLKIFTQRVLVEKILCKKLLYKWMTCEKFPPKFDFQVFLIFIHYYVYKTILTPKIFHITDSINWTNVCVCLCVCF